MKIIDERERQKNMQKAKKDDASYSESERAR